MTKTVSTIQFQQALDATHFLQISSGPVTIYDIEGVCSTTAANYYIQLLGVPFANAVSGTTVPLYSRLAVISGATSGGFSFVYRPEGLDTSTMQNPVGAVATTGSNILPVYIAISSTDNVYTAVAASTDVTVDFEETYLELPNQTITGDLSTGVDSLTVFTDPNAAKRLIQFVVSNSVATPSAPVYLQLFAYAAPATGATALQEWTIAGTTAVTYRFGNGVPFQQYSCALNSSGIFVQNTTLHTGCYLFGSSTPQFFTATVGSHWTMQAFNL